MGSPGTGSRARFHEAETPKDVLPAQFQATVYEVQAASDRVSTLDAKVLKGQAGTPEALLRVLSAVGKSRILYRISQPVNVYSEGITIGRSEPVLRGTRTDVAGNAVNSISYQTVGVILRLSAQMPPKAGNPPQPTVTMSARLSDLPSGDDRDAGEKQMGARGVTFEHSEPLVFGQPVVLVEQTKTTAYVVCYLFSASGVKPSGSPIVSSPVDSVTPSSPESGASIEVLPAQFQATVYEIQADPNKVGTLAAKALAQPADSPEALLKRLGDTGQSRILHRIDQPVNVYSDRITIMGNVPLVTGTRISASGQPINTTMRQNVGVIVRLSAQAPPKEAQRSKLPVMMTVQLSAPAPSDTEIAAGQKATAMRNLSLQHSEPLEFGRPGVLLAVSSASVAEQTTPMAYVIRYIFSPLVGK